jgi:hypothetical protein
MRTSNKIQNIEAPVWSSDVPELMRTSNKIQDHVGRRLKQLEVMSKEILYGLQSSEHAEKVAETVSQALRCACVDIYIYICICICMYVYMYV